MIIAGIATIKHREETFRIALESIYPQVDVVYAVLNNYEDYPEWLIHMPKVRPILGHNTWTDAGKFFFADLCKNCYYIAFDDDILFPRTYVRDMIRAVDKYDGIVSLHGRTYPRPMEDYKKWSANYRCLGTVRHDVMVDLVGTGVCAFNTSRFKVSLQDFIYKNMADVIVSVLAHQQNVPLWVLRHKMGYIKYLNPPGKTIWQTETDTSVQTALLKSVLT